MEIVIDITSMGRSLRKDSKIRVRQPLEKLLMYLKEPSQRKIIEENAPVIMEELNIKNIEFVNSIDKYCTLELKPNLPVMGEKYGNKIPHILKMIGKPENAREFVRNGQLNLKLDDEAITLNLSDILISIKGKQNFIGTYEDGHFVFLDTTITDELREEGVAREIVHAVQNMRKEANLDISERILLSIKPEDAVVKNYEDYIKTETLADEFRTIEDSLIEKELKLDKMVYKVKLRRV
jgi:isoleucyl-tRNA synthetase